MPNYRLTAAAKQELRKSGKNYNEMFSDGLTAQSLRRACSERGLPHDEMKWLINQINALGLQRIDDSLIVLDPGDDCEVAGSSRTKAKPGSREEGRSPLTYQEDSQGRESNQLIPIDIPYRRNDFFTGRARQLAEIKTSLSSPDIRLLAISGLGGIGKTQLAVEYAYRHGKSHSQLLWTSADTEGSLTDGYCQIAQTLGVPVDHSNPHAAVSALKSWMDSHSGWVLFLDNADHPKVLDRFIPNSPRGHIILTSRAQVFDRIGQCELLRLDVFSAQESLEFLQLRTRQPVLSAEEEDAASRLAEDLGGLALALEQAAAFIVETGETFARYVRRFGSVGLELLEASQPELGSYSGTVATTWAVNFREVAAESAAAIELLQCAVFLRSPDEDASLPIPFSYLTDSPEFLDDELAPTLKAQLTSTEDPVLALSNILRPLTRFSLARIEQPGQTFSVHPLVLEVVRNLSGP